MQKEIVYKDETNNDVEICKEMCNRLMRHQAENAGSELYRDILGSMCFENRLLPSFSSTKEKRLTVAYDRGKPVGYVFSTAESFIEECRNARPEWARCIPGDTLWLYPRWLKSPAKIGDLNNLYVLPEYRGLGVGQSLAQRAMLWLKNVPDVEWLFVYVANGNNVAAFYERLGFRFSHKVLGGLIDAYCQKASQSDGGVL